MGSNADEWLESHGLGRYVDAFRENDVDMRALPHLTDADLRELGLSLGHRRLVLAAIEAGDVGQREIPITPSDRPAAPKPTSPAISDGAERRHLTVIFADIVGSTHIAAEVDPEDMRDLLRQYHDTVAGAVTRFDGHVGKYMGDGVLAYFGWPKAHEDHADRAVRAGLEIVRSVQALPATPLGPVAVRIGIASGRVVVGDLVGDRMREDDAMTGATVNLAARLQSEAGPNRVAISDVTRVLVGDAFDLSSIGTRVLKGFGDPLEVFLISGERTVASRFEATRGASHGALVGRDEELEFLKRRWALTCEGRGQVVILSGEPGIGKSRLVEAIVEAAQGVDHFLLRYQCSPYHATSAFHPIIERVQRATVLEREGDAEENYRRLAAMVRAQGQDPDPITPVYAALMGVDVPEAGWLKALEPQELRHTIVHTMTDSVVARAGLKPVLIVFEDVHWIDPSTREILERLVALCSDLPVMIVLTHRPEWSCDWAEIHSYVAAMRLSRLGRNDVAALGAALLSGSLDEALIDELIARTDGVPLFVEELARTLAASDGAGDETVIPASLQGMLLARLDRVSKEARRVSLVASVFGREFQADLLAEVARTSAADLDTALTELRGAEIIYESGLSRGTYVFRHALIQDAAYEALLRRKRRELHGRLARAMERLHPADCAREPEVPARHFTEAGIHAEALNWWSVAAERALERSATYEATSHAAEALSAAERLPASPEANARAIKARILLARACEEAGDLLQAQREACTAAEAAQNVGDFRLFVEAAIRNMESSITSGEAIGPAVELCLEALEDERLTDERARCRLMGNLSRGLMMMGDFEGSRGLGREAEALARKLGDRKALFMQMMPRFMAPTIARDPEILAQGRDRVDALLKLAEELDDSDRGRARAIAVYVSAEIGDRRGMDEALDLLADVGAARQHMHMAWVERHGRSMQAVLDGDFALAERAAREAVQLGRTTHGASNVEGLYGVQMFTIRREQERLAEVAPVIKRLLDESPDEGWKPGFALIAAELGHIEPARRMMAEMAANNFNLVLDAKYSGTLGYLADVAVMIDDADMAAQLYDRLLPYRDMTITIGVATACYGSAGRRLGALAGVLGDWEAAGEHFERALALDEAMRAKPWLARSKATFAAVLEKRGRVSDSARIRTLRDDAWELAQHHGMIALANELRSNLH